MLSAERRQRPNHSDRLVRGATPARAAPQPWQAAEALHARHLNAGNQAVQRFVRSCPLRLTRPGLCPFGGACHACPARVQPKLSVNQPGDRFEQEADQVAERVMRMPDPAATQVTTGPALSAMRLACPDCEEELQRQVEPEEEEEEEETPVQAKHADTYSLRATYHLEAGIRSLKGGGRPLSSSERRFFEPRFGRSFGQVRVHDGARAAQIAGALNARAFTLGPDIFLGTGRHAPGTAAGRGLLAHELAHVVQQSRGQVSRSTLQRRRERVTLAHSGRCPSLEDIARAIPGAKSMAWTAVTWFLSFNPRDRARVGSLLRTNFRSDSASTREVVRDRVLSIYQSLDAAQGGNVEFACEPSTDPECTDRDGYVRTNERNRIHLCPGFFGGTLEERRWMLVHECAHLAGANRTPEQYYAYFGTVDCASRAPQADARAALGNADNYARLIWCMTRRADVEIRPVATP